MDHASRHLDTLNYLQDEDHCVICNAAHARRCLWCRSTCYCSIQCQETDFAAHKLLCQQVASLTPRPSPEHVRAIFFPETECRPQLIWVKYESGVDNFNGTGWTWLLTNPYLGHDEYKNKRLRIEENPTRSQKLGIGFERRSSQRDGHCITMVYRASGNPCPNESILTTLRPSGVGESPLRGPVVAVRERPGKAYEDITLSDLRHLIDYLVSIQLTRIPTESTTEPVAPGHGILIRCRGEIQNNAGVGFKTADISTIGCALGDSGVISQLSKVLGMPLRLRKCTIPGAVQDVTNPNASMLMLTLNPEHTHWGLPHLGWSSNIGNVFVVRDDGEKLDVADLEMMCHFARFRLQPMFKRLAQEKCEMKSEDKDNNEDVPIVGVKPKALVGITWENMEQHWRGRLLILKPIAT